MIAAMAAIPVVIPVAMTMTATPVVQVVQVAQVVRVALVHLPVVRILMENK